MRITNLFTAVLLLVSASAFADVPLNQGNQGQRCVTGRDLVPVLTMSMVNVCARFGVVSSGQSRDRGRRSLKLVPTEVK